MTLLVPLRGIPIVPPDLVDVASVVRALACASNVSALRDLGASSTEAHELVFGDLVDAPRTTEALS
jgi:hypothetical protein